MKKFSYCRRYIKLCWICSPVGKAYENFELTTAVNNNSRTKPGLVKKKTENYRIAML